MLVAVAFHFFAVATEQEERVVNAHRDGHTHHDRRTKRIHVQHVLGKRSHHRKRRTNRHRKRDQRNEHESPRANDEGQHTQRNRNGERVFALHVFARLLIHGINEGTLASHRHRNPVLVVDIATNLVRNASTRIVQIVHKTILVLLRIATIERENGNSRVVVLRDEDVLRQRRQHLISRFACQTRVDCWMIRNDRLHAIVEVCRVEISVRLENAALCLRPLHNVLRDAIHQPTIV
mmetsp:Transcript_35271/g.57685  ORF Transcript_35271/g.57685 Transcript_35271/m.57685 type:complete len:235 (-) Transcript_35271:495-1199(-)